MDCTNYNDEKCPKALTLINNIEKNKLELLFVGCWGVYCKDGEMDVIKYKKGEFKTSKGIFGGKSVAQGMAEYSMRNDIDAVILAGDNIYSRNPTKEEMDNPKNFPNLKDDLNDMELQFNEGFVKCMNEVKTDNFYLAIGNHDITNCNILNKQLNYNQRNWKLPGLYYNVIYNIEDKTQNQNYKVNLIFIDTNLYDKQKTCNSKEYPHEDDEVTDEHKKWLEGVKNQQKTWIKNVIKTNKCEWNLIIGHIPFMNNPHKKIKDSKFDYVINNELVNDIYEIRNEIKNVNLDIQLYLCADEHNQQFIKCPDNYLNIPNLPAIVISGSGGTELDDFMQSPTLSPCTIIGNKSHGFVSLNINKSELNITYYESRDMKSIEYRTINIDLNGKMVQVK